MAQVLTQHAMKVGVRLSYSSSFMCMRVPEWKDHMTLKKKERSLLTPALHKDPFAVHLWSRFLEVCLVVLDITRLPVDRLPQVTTPPLQAATTLSMHRLTTHHSSIKLYLGKSEGVVTGAGV